MTLTGSVQAVVMAAGKGSRMTDLTCTKPKCLLPVAGCPLVWHPLNMLQSNGFTEAIVIVPDVAKNEVIKIPEKYNLSIKLDVVGISGQEDMGTADSLRLVSDKLTGSDIIIVSGDLVMEESLRGIMDLHRMKNASFTSLLAKNSIDMKTVIVPGDKKNTKYKKERDLIGLHGDHLCLFTAEADVEEEEVKISSKVMRNVGSFTVHTNLLDGHLYVMKKWVCDYIISDRNVSTIKGELLPIVVKKQFSSSKQNKNKDDQDKRTIQDFVDLGHNLSGGNNKRLYSCYAYITELPCYRVNTLPSYWHCNSVLRKENKIHPSTVLGDKAQLSNCCVSSNCNIADKTTLAGVTMGSGVKIMEKVRITNCVIMDNVTVKSGTMLEDSIFSDGVTVGEKCGVKMSIIGKGQNVDNGGQLASQLLLDTDRMMEV